MSSSWVEVISPGHLLVWFQEPCWRKGFEKDFWPSFSYRGEVLEIGQLTRMTRGHHAAFQGTWPASRASASLLLFRLCRQLWKPGPETAHESVRSSLSSKRHHCMLLDNSGSIRKRRTSTPRTARPVLGIHSRGRQIIWAPCLLVSLQCPEYLPGPLSFCSGYNRGSPNY